MKPIVVIKLGGSSLQNSDTILQLAALVRGYQKRRYRIVLVHGGGPAINAELSLKNIKWQFINGQRQTTPEMMTVIDDVLAKKVNSALVNELKQSGVAALGLSGADAKILFCSQATPELMCVGKVETVNTAGLKEILNQFGGKVPVVAPIGYGASNASGVEKFNINADWAACQIAVALDAKKLIFLTDQDGILDQHKKIVSRANSFMINHMINEGIIFGGMFTKVKAMMAALNAGVKYVIVLNANIASQALTSDAVGTLLTESYTSKEVTNERAL
jgi:acetylglutamate kinase